MLESVFSTENTTTNEVDPIPALEEFDVQIAPSTNRCTAVSQDSGAQR